MYGNVIRVNNVNEALPNGLHLLLRNGEPATSRGLETLRVPGPVSTVYEHPCDRVLFDPIRDANPFFHIIEAMWILSGSNKVDLPQRFLGNITRFSDDGKTFHGAYGHRLRHAFGFDQIEMACAVLKERPDSRQVVLSIWSPVLDLATTTKDMPCNDMLMLDITRGKLNMTVCNRSNDAIWGAYGANAVQFSYLLEYMALRCGADIGRYVQQSNNFHVYTDNPFWLKFKQGEYTHGHIHNPYMGTVRACPLGYDDLDAAQVWQDCKLMAKYAEEGNELTQGGYTSMYFHVVVLPAVRAYNAYKVRDFDKAREHLSHVAALDWRKAMLEWVERRAEKVVA